jgi:2-iminobutanoate/2-iminopropanoate deaminase
MKVTAALHVAAGFVPAGNPKGDHVMMKIVATGAVALLLAAGLQFTSFAQTVGAVFERQTYNYGNWTKGRFAEVVTVKGPGKMIFLAGAGSEEEMDGAILHKADAYAQCKYAYEKIRKILARHGATMSDIVKITAYVTDIRARDDYGKCRREAFEGAELSTHTFVNVSQLAWPGMIVEVDAIAVVAQ